MVEGRDRKYLERHPVPGGPIAEFAKHVASEISLSSQPPQPSGTKLKEERRRGSDHAHLKRD